MAMIEALVALLTVTFGTLALTSLQLNLSRDAEISSQRSEAVRLMQDKIENLRHAASMYRGNSSDLTSGTDTVTTPVIYTRRWTLNAAPASTGQLLTVDITWFTRSGRLMEVSLATRLAPESAVDSMALLGRPPEPGSLRRPANWTLPITLKMISLGNGESALKPPGDAPFLIFSDSSGKLVRRCKVSPIKNDSAAQQLATLIGALKDPQLCIPASGLVLAGKLERDFSIGTSEWTSMEPNLGIDTSALTRSVSNLEPITCHYEKLQEGPSNRETGDYKAYLCVVPLEVVSTNNPSVKVPSWSGKVFWSGTPVTTLANNPLVVCRYEIGVSGNLLNPNQRNVQPYQGVSQSLFLQNYRIVRDVKPTYGTLPQCPNNMNHAPTPMEPYDISGVLHQSCPSNTDKTSLTDLCPVSK